MSPGAWRGVTLNLAPLQGSPGLEENLFWGLSGELVPLACSVSVPASSSSCECHLLGDGECRVGKGTEPWNPWRAPSGGIFTVWSFGESGHGAGNQSRVCPHRAPQPSAKDARRRYEGPETRCVPCLLALVCPSSLSLS